MDRRLKIEDVTPNSTVSPKILRCHPKFDGHPAYIDQHQWSGDTQPLDIVLYTLIMDRYIIVGEDISNYVRVTLSKFEVTP